MERPIGYPEALRVLRSWEGRRVHVRISDPQGAELTSVEGVLSNDPTADHDVFGVNEPGDAAATVPVALVQPYGCILGDGNVTIATTPGMVVTFSSAEAGRASASTRSLRGRAQIAGSED